MLPQTPDVAKITEARKRVLRAETIGILIFVIVGLAIVLLRYGSFLDWHIR